MNVGKLVGRDSALTGPVRADGLLHFRCVCPVCGWTDGLFCPAWMGSGAEGKAASWGCIFPKHLDLQQSSPVRISGRCPSPALLHVARTCLQTPLVPEAEGWRSQPGAGAGRALLFLVFPNTGKNRKGATPHYFLRVGRNKLDSKNWHSFLGTRSGHRAAKFPFPLPLIFGIFTFCAREVGCEAGICFSWLSQAECS